MDENEEQEESADAGEAPEEKETQAEAGPPIVGIGASAGGVDALLRLVPRIDPDCGLAFVVVQHLDPQAKSTLAELLRRASRLPVHLITDDMPAAPGAIYVIPPGVALAIHRRRLRLSRPPQTRGPRMPIDMFLLSLAEDVGEQAACVILSGAGSDGTIGLRAIKEHGGLCVAQAEAEYDGMMRSAVATGLVDHVLPVEDIPGKLLDHFRHRDEVARIKGPERGESEAAGYLAQICALLRVRTGHDFKDYKERTLVRRVQRRMRVLQIDDVRAFIERLRADPREIDLLFQDLLIGVTNFFRDPAAFDALMRDVIPRLFGGKGADDTVRVWVPGCSTGEEAYSIAILLREAAARVQTAPKLQVFASDIEERAVEVARTGRYPATIVKDVRPEYLERYFLREEGTYRVVNELREMVLFALHNLLRDAPFSRLDLISCRNLLIYLKPDLQGRLITLFHYALRPNGFLFLGPSENVTRQARLFGVVDRTHHIYQRRAPAERRLPEFPLVAPDATRHLTAPGHRPAAVDLSLQTLAERRILERYAPPYAVITREGEVLHASTRTGKFLELPAGVPDTNIFSLTRRGLRLELRAALHRAISTGQTAAHPNLVVDTNGGQQALDLFVEPLRRGTGEEHQFLVVFRELGGLKPAPEEEARVTADLEEVKNLSLRQLEAELHATRERLQSTTEELESSNEELKSSNEELSSMNEELQTVNSELSARVEELGRANSDIVNLLESTQIATLFLDRGLCVKSFTPTAKDVFRLVESDAGRPISHVRARFVPDLVQEDAARVLRTLATIERQVCGTDSHRMYIMRVLPYRTVDNVINGVVITFTDITEIVAAEARIGELTRDLRNRIESLETLLDLVPIAIFITEEREGESVRINRRAARLIGEPEYQRGMAATAARLRLRVNGEEIPEERHPLQLAARSGEALSDFEAELLRPDGGSVPVAFSVVPLFGEHGRPRGAIAAVTDIRERKATEAHQQMLLHELQHRVKNILASIAALVTRMMRGNDSVEAFHARFLSRLHAMGRMQDLLSQRNWEGADLNELVTAALAPHGVTERPAMTADGPRVLLGPKATTALGAILHELATNAAKYGALSVPEGEVTITWRVANGRLSLKWIEAGGPTVTPPARQGFGLGFVKRSLEYELEGSCDVAFPPEGVRAVIEFPLHHEGTQETHGAARKASD